MATMSSSWPRVSMRPTKELSQNNFSKFTLVIVRYLC
jgi:hypothetical protein